MPKCEHCEVQIDGAEVLCSTCTEIRDNYKNTALVYLDEYAEMPDAPQTKEASRLEDDCSLQRR